MNRQHPQRGFTLVELLVAMFVTAIMFTIGYGAINQALVNRDALLARQERLLQVQRSMRLFSQDFTQLAPRPVREQSGLWQPALEADARKAALVSFTRGGWANPAGVQRAMLQRVRYVLADKTLWRETFDVLDATLDTRPKRRRMLDHVIALKLRYMDEAHAWHDQWPPASLQAGPRGQFELRKRPIAVEASLELEDWGTLVRLIEIAG
jgi:general secretion pathway protein J